MEGNEIYVQRLGLVRLFLFMSTYKYTARLFSASRIMTPMADLFSLEVGMVIFFRLTTLCETRHGARLLEW